MTTPTQPSGLLAIIDKWMDSYDHMGTGDSRSASASEREWQEDRATIKAALESLAAHRGEVDCDFPGRKAAQEIFTEYFVQNYPGPRTIIYDPNWYAPRIFRAACYALKSAEQEVAATHPPQAQAGAGGGVALIAAERRRQVEAEGWTPEHDDKHDSEELAQAAACYALGAPFVSGVKLWPWEWSWWKTDGRLRNLVKAGALIAAEIDRLQRAALEASHEPE